MKHFLKKKSFHCEFFILPTQFFQHLPCHLHIYRPHNSSLTLFSLLYSCFVPSAREKSKKLNIENKDIPLVSLKKEKHLFLGHSNFSLFSVHHHFGIAWFPLLFVPSASAGDWHTLTHIYIFSLPLLCESPTSSSFMQFFCFCISFLHSRSWTFSSVFTCIHL